VLGRETANTNFMLFCLTQSGLEPLTYRTRDEQAKHYTRCILFQRASTLKIQLMVLVLYNAVVNTNSGVINTHFPMATLRCMSSHGNIKESLKIPERQYESVNRRRTDSTMAICYMRSYMKVATFIFLFFSLFFHRVE
jgi:hypothetical protein